MLKNLPLRPPGTINTRHIDRSRVDPVNVNQFQSPARITASIVIPTLGVEHNNPQMRWVQPTVHKQAQTKSFRLPAAVNSTAMVNGTKKIERAASTSLPDLPLNVQRTQPLSQS